MVWRAAAEVREKCNPTDHRNSANVSRQKMQTTPTKCPYRAVICGEEHIVKGWRGGNLITDTDLAADNVTLDKLETRLVQAVSSLDAGRA